MPAPKTRWVVLIVLLSTVLILVTGVFVFNAIEQGRWQRFVDSLEGAPLTFESIEALRAPLDDGPTLAGVIRSRAADLDRFSKQPLLEGNFTDGIETASVDDARATRDTCLELIQEIVTTRPAGRYTITFKDGFGGDMSHYTALRSASRLLRLDARLHLIDGRPVDALNRLDSQLALADILASQPTLVGGLMRAAFLSVATNGVQDAVIVGEVPEDALRSAQERLEPYADQLDLNWSLLGERAFMFEMLEQVMDGTIVQGAMGGPWSSDFLAWLPDGLIRANQFHACERMTRLIRVADDPRALLDAAAELEGQRTTGGAGQVFSNLLLPSFKNAIASHTRTIGGVRAAHAVLAAERFRLAEGRLPNELAELVPAFLTAVPVDPFDGNPFRLAETSEGIVIYSIGDNEVDDGGQVSMPAGSRKHPLDWGLVLRRPDLRGVTRIESDPQLDTP